MIRVSSPPTGRLVSAAELAAALRLPPPTPEQVAVVEAPLTPGVVVAGAGSGKTETMAARAVWLVANGLVRPDQVLGLTFTRKAARELGERLRRRLAQLRAYGLTPFGEPGQAVGGGVADCGEPVVVTYDAYAGRIVSEHALRLGREPDARLVTEAVAWQVATRMVRGYDGPMDRVDAAFTTVVDAVLALHGELSGHLVEPAALREWTLRLMDRLAAIPRAPGQRTAGQLYAAVAQARARQEARLQLLPLVEAFRADKRCRELVDFSDQAALAARLGVAFPEVGQLERSRYAVVMLDEYQDTSHAQLVLLRALFGNGHPVTAVGDPCQSIYGWRGASAASLSAFRRHFAAADGAPAPCRTLSTSFRNAEPVLAVANAVAAPLRRQGLVVPELTTPGGCGDALDGPGWQGAASRRNGAVGGPARSEVVCALHSSVEEEAADIAERIVREWAGGPGGLAASGARPSVAVLVPAAGAD